MNPYLIYQATIVNEGREFKGSVLIQDGKITEIYQTDVPRHLFDETTVLNAAGLYLFPGIIDDQVHFREPGLTHKGDIASESRAAIAGGVTSFMEMPNTNPPTLTRELLEQKYRIAAEHSPANFSFYMGASNDNYSELVRTDPTQVCGIKVFMGASTGNMLVNDAQALEKIFSLKGILIATHCEDEQIISSNSALYRAKFGDAVPIRYHSSIRSEEACYKSSSMAVAMARKFGTRLHILHISTARELSLFDHSLPLADKRITAEVCVHHLWFTQDDYERLGTLIKWNPAIKTSRDREALIKALNENMIDVVASDHAPHTIEEKDRSYFRCPSGGPLVQHTLQAMLELSRQGRFPLTLIADKMCHAPAIVFHTDKRGFIRPGYWADLVLVNPNKNFKVRKDNILYKCMWSPFEEVEFHSTITHTFVNGNLVYENGKLHDTTRGMRLTFNR